MANVIYNYPKSSCACYECDKDVYKFNNGPPTNLGVSGYNVSDYYDCFQIKPFKQQIEPRIASGVESINPGVYSMNKRDPTFVAIDSSKCKYSTCEGTTYLNSDARLFNAAAGQWIQLDKPPINSSQKLNTLTTDTGLNSYGKNYETYSNINSGQIMYYIAKDREDAYYDTLFSTPFITTGVMYKDPMGNIKPIYIRNPINPQTNPMTTEYNNSKPDELCLSFISDTQKHREDIITSQMTSINQQRWEPRWTNNKT